MAEWRQVCGDDFEAEAGAGALAGRHVWVSDGVLGFARPMADGETAEAAVAEFEEAGESADEWWVYQDGERVE